MKRFADTKTISKQQEALGELHPDIIGFREEVAKKFPNVRYTSGFRPGAKTKQGKLSRHATKEAVDAVAEREFYNFLTNDREGISLMNKYNLGILDETSAEMLAKTGGTGAHYHIGKDMQLVAQTKARFNKLGEMEVPKRTKLELNENLPVQYAEQVQIAEKPKEEEDEAIDVAKQSLELKMGLKEQLLTALQQAQIQPLERIVDNTPQQIEPFRSPYEGLMQDGGELFMQKGGKTPIYVNDINDPRYKAYQDSLSLYNKGKIKEKQYNNFLNSINVSTTELDITPKKDFKDLGLYLKHPIKPIELRTAKDTGGGYNTDKNGNTIDYEEYYVVNGKGRNEISDKNLINKINKGYSVYKKPIQPVIVDSSQQPKNSTKIETELFIPKPKVENLSPITSNEIISNFELTTQPIVQRTQGMYPKYWDITDTNNQRFGGYEQNYQITNPDELREVPKELWTREVKPRYQDGGNVIEDNQGQWKYPGEVTKINSNNITMEGITYPVLGVSNTGDVKMMYPWENYQFEGESVTEYPIIKKKLKLKKK